jgi:hypothetical protein
VRRLVPAFCAAAALVVVAAPTERRLGFPAGLDDWQEKDFVGTTDYRAVDEEGRPAVLAAADGSASALYRRVGIDLEATPYLSWRWRVEGTYGPDIDETAKSGDDYPARIYVVRRGGLAFWRTRALNYVWSSARPVGSRWSNAYAGDSVRMLAVDSGDARAGEWVAHTRDVRADWRAAFGEEIDSLDGVAVMTDGDDTGSAMRAWFADIRFLAERPGGEVSR